MHKGRKSAYTGFPTKHDVVQFIQRNIHKILISRRKTKKNASSLSTIQLADKALQFAHDMYCKVTVCVWYWVSRNLVEQRTHSSETIYT